MRSRWRVRCALLTAVLLAPALLAPLGGCIFTQDTVTPLDASARPEGKPLKIEKSAKAHLEDGSVVLFHKGFEVGDGELRGAGEQFDLTRTRRSQVQSVPLARVAALESYQREPHGPLSAAGIILGVPAVLVGSTLLFVAIFGSCPTVYSPVPGGELLEAELYSHSIAQRFEGNDLDRLEGARAVDGTIRLRIANEALETHYTNRLELVAADHPPDFEAFPDPAGGVVLLGGAVPLGGARSRSGREVGAAVSGRGDAWYQTGPDLDAEAAQRPTDDWIEGTVEVPPGAATVTVGLRLRNTLLDTVLLYDVLLRSQGAGALAWLDRFDRDPLAAWRWHSWFDDRFALRVLLEEDGAYREVARVPVTGPIAWHQTAVTFPAPAAGKARLRLASLADNWQVDWVGVSAGRAPRARLTVIPAGTVTGPDGASAAAAAAIRGDDGEYLSTGPGESYTLSFPAGEPGAGLRRTWLLRSRGYYIEWLRGEWLTAAARGPLKAPEPGDAAIVAASRLWAQKRERFEREFFSTRIGGEVRP